MKNIFFIVTSLLFSLHFNVNNRPSTNGEKYIVEVTTPAINNLNEITLPVVEETKKEFATENEKKKIRKNIVKTVNVNSSINKNNRTLHKNLMEQKSYITSSNIQFNFDEYDLKNTDMFNEILQYADKLIFDSSLQLSISGFTDNIGDGYYNDVLSFKRAETVKDYLVELGVPASQIILSFNGVADPIADNATDEGRKINRRVEFALFASS